MKQGLVEQGMDTKEDKRKTALLNGLTIKFTPAHFAQPLQSWSIPLLCHPWAQICTGALQPGVTYTIQTAATEYQNTVPRALKNSHLPISGLILEPRTFQVNGEEVKGSSTLTSYKEGQATPGFHTLRATPKRRGRPQL